MHGWQNKDNFIGRIYLALNDPVRVYCCQARRNKEYRENSDRYRPSATILDKITSIRSSEASWICFQNATEIFKRSTHRNISID